MDINNALLDISEIEDERFLMGFVANAYSATESTNDIVVVITAIVMVFYVVAYIVVAVLERRKLSRGSLHMPTMLMNDPGSYYYVITVATGSRPCSGLGNNGSIQMRIRGSAGNSRIMVIRNLEDAKGPKMFQRGNVDCFLLPVNVSLGEVIQLDIDIFSKDYKAIDWYLKYIRVADLYYGTQNDFMFDKWIATQDHQSYTSQGKEPMSTCRRILERILSSYFELNIWTSPCTESCSTSAFTRSLRVSFCTMTLSVIMLINLLVCFIPVLQMQRSGRQLPTQARLINEALIFSFIASLAVILVQYLFEILLRRVRTPPGLQTVVSCDGPWKKKHSFSDESDGAMNPMSVFDITTHNMGGYSGSQSNPNSPDQNMTCTKKTGYESSMPATMHNIPCDCCSRTLCLHESVIMNPSRNKDDCKYAEVVKSILWDSQDGIVSKYITDSERKMKCSDQSSKHKKDDNTVTNQNLAKALVSLILQESVKSLKTEEGCKKKASMSYVQDYLYKELHDSCMQETGKRDVIHNLRPEKNYNCGVGIHGQVSDGQLINRVVYDKSNVSVTSSCPDIHSPNLDMYGPVVNRLSESISAIAFRNSFTSLQHTATEKLVSQSEKRIRSFTSLVREENLEARTAMRAAYAETDRSVPQKSESMNAKTLLEFISPNRANRLMEDSMRFVAQASLSSLVSDEALQKLRRTAVDCNDKSLQSFTFEVVNNLYNIVRAKLEALIENHINTEVGVDKMSRKQQIAEFLESTDAEIRKSVLPPLEEYIQSLLVDQAKSFSDMDVDLIMMAFSGQYVDTIVTNAVLQTHVGLLKAKQSFQHLQSTSHCSANNHNNNCNNNNNRKCNKTDAAIQMALAHLEQTAEVENIVRQICDYMLINYKHRKGCTVQHSKEVDDTMKATFAIAATTQETFERVLNEAIAYLHTLSEHCDMANVHANPELMARLSDTFLTSGFDIETHATITEDLSNCFLDKAIQHACAVVATQLIEQFLAYDNREPTLTLQGASTPQDKSSRYSPSLYHQRLDESKVSRDQDSDDWATSSGGSPNNDYHMKTSPRTVIRKSFGSNSTDTLKWSPILMAEEGDNGMQGISPINTYRTKHGTNSKRTDMHTLEDGASPPCPPESTPLLPKDVCCCEEALAHMGKRGLLYTPAERSIVLSSDPAANREMLWQLDLERDVLGESTKCMPSFAMQILQVFVLIVTVSSLSACIMFGMRLPEKSAIAWLVAVVVGVSLHMFVWETLKVVAIAFYYVICLDDV